MSGFDSWSCGESFDSGQEYRFRAGRRSSLEFSGGEDLNIRAANQAARDKRIRPISIISPAAASFSPPWQEVT
jgi:hypothetical protein